MTTDLTPRADVNGNDLFALMSALGHLAGQASFAPRADNLFQLITSAILKGSANKDLKKATD
jgi:hypothetical protein